MMIMPMTKLTMMMTMMTMSMTMLMITMIMMMDNGSQEDQAFRTSSAVKVCGLVQRLCLGQVGTFQLVRTLIFTLILESCDGY